MQVGRHAGFSLTKPLIDVRPQNDRALADALWQESARRVGIASSS